MEGGRCFSLLVDLLSGELCSKQDLVIENFDIPVTYTTGTDLRRVPQLVGTLVGTISSNFSMTETHCYGSVAEVFVMVTDVRME